MRDSLAQQIGGHVPRMYRVALRIVGSGDNARDVVQDACVKALRALGDFDGRCALPTWLHRITVNCARDHLRKKRVASRDRVDLNYELAGMVEALGCSPADQAEQAEMRRIVSAMVERLPDDCRSALVLTQLDGYSYDEAAAIEEQPRGTIASRVHRARKILMEQLSVHYGGEPAA